MFPIQCPKPTCYSYKVTNRPFKEPLTYNSLIGSVLRSKYFVYFFYTLGALTIAQLILNTIVSSQTTDVSPFLANLGNNAFAFLWFLLSVLILIYYRWLSFKNGRLLGLKYKCHDCKYTWIQLKTQAEIKPRLIAFSKKNLELARKRGRPKEVAYALQTRAAYLGEYENDWLGSKQLAEECEAIAAKLQDKRLEVFNLNVLGLALVFLGDYAAANTVLDKTRQLAQANGEWQIYAAILNNIALALLYQGYYNQSRQFFEESTIYLLKMGGMENEGMLWNLEGLAGAAFGLGQPARAIRLAGVSHTLRSKLGIPLPLVAQNHLTQTVNLAQTQLGPLQAQRIWQEGSYMSLPVAIQYALSNQP